MTHQTIRIERAPGDGVETGVIRRFGSENPDACLPDLLAHRPDQKWRFFRLAAVVGAAKVLSNEQHSGSGRSLEAALASIEDSKGDFTAVWRTQDDLEKFSPFVDRALASEGEDEILHRLDTA